MNAHVGPAGAASSAPVAATETWDLLHALRTLRNPIMLSTPADGALGPSVVLEADRSECCLRVDAPRGDPQLVTGATLGLDACIDGRALRFQTRYEGHERESRPRTYRLVDPWLSQDRQRRHSYRVRLPANRRHPLRLGTATRTWSGRLLDVSCNGCGVGVEGTVDLQPGQPVDVAFGWNDLRVRCKAVVCHTMRSGALTRLGLALYLEDELPRRSIEQAVLNLQRDLLRQRRS